MASNSWVISGKHTKSGKPLIANDTHMETVLPSVWSLGELSWDENFVIGAQLVGVPGVSVGRNKHVAWSITAALSDNTDIWEEEINDDNTAYKVDGEWRKLTKVKEQIKVKGEEAPTEYEIAFTHRGAVMDFELLRFNTVLLFGDMVPKGETNAKFSFGWAQSAPGDASIDVLQTLRSVESVKQTMEKFDQIGKDGYQGFMANAIMADSDGNIGYQHLAPLPVRKDKTPYIGCRVLDGRTSAHDWESGNKLVPISELARSYNPKKGYIVTANNK